MARRSHIGIMGGTFDPVHEGHLAVARSVAEQLDIDRVLFIPTGNPNFKQGQELASAEDRVHMVRLAIADDPLFELDPCEVERPGVTYTADTLEELVRRHEDARFFFIMGTDSAITLPKWRRAEEVARLATIVVARRPGQSSEEARDALAASPVEFDVVYLEVPQVDVSSTELRRRIAHGEDIRGMVPGAVADHIARQGLYRA